MASGRLLRFHTANKTMTSTTLPAVSAEQATATSATLAVLPAQMLYVAAQFASKNPVKRAQCYINIRKDCNTITIASTDGHRLFRVRIPAETAYFLDGELMLPPAAFKKRVAKADYAIITNQGTAELRSTVAGLIQSVPCSTGCDSPFPEVDRLIPDTFTGNPGAPIAFNADYLATFLKEVARFCDNGCVTMQFNAHPTPLLFTGETTLEGTGMRVTMEYLLMPVQIRN